MIDNPKEVYQPYPNESQPNQYISNLKRPRQPEESEQPQEHQHEQHEQHQHEQHEQHQHEQHEQHHHQQQLQQLQHESENFLTRIVKKK
ncbi:hypothetical protein QCA50_012269 [Cerrena zonata]|uniref:Uncharacterized protein n=1 Tax=Cerrena zonata TaxID=2478898 RepID=A0AAW0FUZ0_9APHY